MARGKKLQNLQNLYVDGGLNDNYPVWLFDKWKYLNFSLKNYKLSPQKRVSFTNTSHQVVFNDETLGLMLATKTERNKYRPYRRQYEFSELHEKSFFEFAAAVMGSTYQKQASDHVLKGDYLRTIYVDSLNVSTIDFGLSDETKKALIASGRECVDNFLNFADRDDQASEKINSPDVATHLLYTSSASQIVIPIYNPVMWLLLSVSAVKLSYNLISIKLNNFFVQKNELVNEMVEENIYSMEKNHDSQFDSSNDIIFNKLDSEESSKSCSSTKNTLEASYQSSLNEQLPLIQWGLHYFSKWLPWNKERELICEEIDNLYQFQDWLLTFPDKLEFLNKGCVGQSGLFNDKLYWIEYRIQSTKNTLANVLNSGRATTRQLEEIASHIERIKATLKRLSEHQETLSEWEKETKALLKEGKCLRVNYNSLKDILKKEASSYFTYAQQFWKVISNTQQKLPRLPTEEYNQRHLARN